MIYVVRIGPLEGQVTTDSEDEARTAIVRVVTGCDIVKWRAKAKTMSRSSFRDKLEALESLWNRLEVRRLVPEPLGSGEDLCDCCGHERRDHGFVVGRDACQVTSCDCLWFSPLTRFA